MSTKVSKNTSKQPLRIILYGPQASGKGTQATILAKRYHLPLIVAGDIHRAAMKKKTPLGRRILHIVDHGGYVSAALANTLMAPAIKRASRTGYILDGYPRKFEQFRFLNRLAPPTVAIKLTLPTAEVIERLAQRLVCPKGHTYHITAKPPRRPGRCDIDGLPLAPRHDDTPAKIRSRLALHHKFTEPVIAQYRKRGIVITVDGRPSILKVAKEIDIALKKFLRQ